MLSLSSYSLTMNGLIRIRREIPVFNPYETPRYDPRFLHNAFVMQMSRIAQIIVSSIWLSRSFFQITLQDDRIRIAVRNIMKIDS